MPTTTPILDRRRLMLGAAALATLGLAGCSQSEAADVREPDGTVDEAELYADLPIEDVVEGDPDAPVKIVEYASMTCGHCRAFHEETWPAIKERYVDTGKVAFVLREFPFDPRSAAAFMLARCAPEGRRSAMIDAMFETQESWAQAENGQAALFDVARLAQIGEDEFKACLTDQELTAKVFGSFERGQALGVDSTPTFFIDNRRYAGNMGVDEMSAVIDAALAARGEG